MMNKIKNIAVIASADRKTDLIEWSYFNKKALSSHNILALGFAANILEGTLNKKISVSESGKSGEYAELCTLILNGYIDAVIIFSEAAEILHSKGLSSVTETAIENNILVAANKTTADFVINSPLLESEYEIHKDEKKVTDKTPFSTSLSYPLAKAS